MYVILFFYFFTQILYLFIFVLKNSRLELNMELPSGQQSQPIGTASAASAEQVNSNYGYISIEKWI